MQSVLGQEASMRDCGDRRASGLQGECAQRSVVGLRTIARQPSYSVMVGAKKVNVLCNKINSRKGRWAFQSII